MWITHSAWFSNLPSRPCFAAFFPVRLRDRRVWRRYGNLLIWIFRNDVVLLVRKAEAQHCAALVRASAARCEEESGAGLVRRNFAEGFQVLLSQPWLSAVCCPVMLKNVWFVSKCRDFEISFLSTFAIPNAPKSGNMLYIEQKKKSRRHEPSKLKKYPIRRKDIV